MTFIVFLLGVSIGSFLNVVIDRLPIGEDIVFTPSHCDFCKKRLRWFELIPLVSFIIQNGVCRRCRKGLSVQYPLIELMTGLGFVWLYTVGFSTIFMSVLASVIWCTLVAIFVIDYKHMIIPDELTAVLLLSALFMGIPVLPHLRFVHLLTALISLTGFYVLYVLTRGRGVGFGDVKLSFVLGLLLGYPNALIAFYAAFLTGAIYGVILISAGRAGMKSKIAFGPFLIIGFVIAVMWGNSVYTGWLSLI